MAGFLVIEFDFSILILLALLIPLCTLFLWTAMRGGKLCIIKQLRASVDAEDGILKYIPTSKKIGMPSNKEGLIHPSTTSQGLIHPPPPASRPSSLP
jgi:hypothetical protein